MIFILKKKLNMCNEFSSIHYYMYECDLYVHLYTYAVCICEWEKLNEIVLFQIE